MQEMREGLILLLRHYFLETVPSIVHGGWLNTLGPTLTPLINHSSQMWTQKVNVLENWLNSKLPPNVLVLTGFI